MLELLYMLKERLESSAVAGVSLVAQDFKLKKIVADIGSIEKKSPVFERIYSGASALFIESKNNKCLDMMDLLALINAVLVTQGSVFDNNIEVEEIVSAESEYSRISSKVLSRLYEATHGTGGGRLEIIRETLRDKYIMKDYRVRSYLIHALSDKYQEIAELIACKLKIEGQAIIPLLKANFDYDGKNETSHRLNIISSVAKEKENNFYLDILSHEVHNKVKIEAIKALQYEQSNADYLLELYLKEKKSEILDAISNTLSNMGKRFNENYVNKLIPTLDKNKIYSSISALGDSEQMLNLILDDLEKQLSIGSLDKKQTQKFLDSLAYTLNKQSERLYDFYITCLNSADKFFKAKYMPIWASNFYMLVDIIADHIIIKNNDMAESFVSRLEKEYGDKVLPLRFTFDLIKKDSDYVYETYKKYMDSNNKKTEFSLSTGIMAVLTRIVFNAEEGRHYIYKRTAASFIKKDDWTSFSNESDDRGDFYHEYLQENLCDKWYKDILNCSVEMHTYFMSKKQNRQQFSYTYNTAIEYGFYDGDFYEGAIAYIMYKIIDFKSTDGLNVILTYLVDDKTREKFGIPKYNSNLHTYLRKAENEEDNSLLKLVSEIYSSNEIFALYRTNRKSTIFEVISNYDQDQIEIMKLLTVELKKHIK